MFAKAFLRVGLAAALLSAAAVAASAQGARETLATFPDSQAVVYVDAKRVLNDALPKVVPAAQLDKMFAEVQQKTGFDLHNVHFVGLGFRYKEPFSPSTPPDVVGVIKGDINAASLMSLLKMVSGGRTTEESYKGRSITVVNLRQEGTGEGARHSGSPYPELAVVSPDANTIILGVPAYVRAAIDAVDGGQRLRADLLDLATRNPNNLLSLAGDLPASLADVLAKTGMPQNDEVTRIVKSLKQLGLALNMGETDFGLQTIVKTDSADTARGLNGMVTIGLGFARAAIEDELVKAAAENPARGEENQVILDFLRSIRNTATDEELQIEASLPQATVATMVKKEMEKQERREEERRTAAAGELPRIEKPKPTTPRRRSRRRRH